MPTKILAVAVPSSMYIAPLIYPSLSLDITVPLTVTGAVAVNDIGEFMHIFFSCAIVAFVVITSGAGSGVAALL